MLKSSSVSARWIFWLLWTSYDMGSIDAKIDGAKPTPEAVAVTKSEKSLVIMIRLWFHISELKQLGCWLPYFGGLNKDRCSQ